VKKNRVHSEAMEARSVDTIPSGKEWQYEPKWDGFRCLLARDAGTVAMYSKSGQDLSRYFPEVVAAPSVNASSVQPSQTAACSISCRPLKL
jgi:ATP-dependent DNA ligase